MAYEKYESLLEEMDYGPYEAAAGIRRGLDEAVTTGSLRRRLQEAEPEGAVSGFSSGPYLRGGDIKRFARGRGRLAGQHAARKGASVSREQMDKSRWIYQQLQDELAAQRAEAEARGEFRDQVIKMHSQVGGYAAGLTLLAGAVKKKYDALETTEPETPGLEVGEDPWGDTANWPEPQPAEAPRLEVGKDPWGNPANWPTRRRSAFPRRAASGEELETARGLDEAQAVRSGLAEEALDAAFSREPSPSRWTTWQGEVLDEPVERHPGEGQVVTGPDSAYEPDWVDEAVNLRTGLQKYNMSAEDIKQSDPYQSNVMSMVKALARGRLGDEDKARAIEEIQYAERAGFLSTRVLRSPAFQAYRSFVRRAERAAAESHPVPGGGGGISQEALESQFK